MQQLFELPGDWTGCKVRTTTERARRVSVFDVIGAVSGGTNPRQKLADLRNTHPSVVSLTDDWQFPGARQRPTPVVDARGLVVLINLLPGAKAAAFRAAGADILVRYLGGDETLVGEIHRNRERQEALPEDNPLRIFGEDVEASARGRGLLGHETAGVYIVRYGPRLIVSAPAEHEVLGYGYTEDVTRRIPDHRRRFGGCEVLDFAPTWNKNVETLFQRYLKLHGRLVKGRVDGEDGADVTEIFTVKGDYEVCREALFGINEAHPHPLQHESTGDRVRLMEAEVRMKEADARIKESEARIKEAEVRMKEVEARIEETMTAREAIKRGRPEPASEAGDAPSSTRARTGDITSSVSAPLEEECEMVEFTLPPGSGRERPVRQLTVAGDFIKDHESTWAAVRDVPSACKGGIYQCLNAGAGRVRDRTCGGFAWIHVPEDEIKPMVVRVPRGTTGHIVQLSMDGEEINRYSEREKAERTVRVGRPAMKAALESGSELQGFIWKVDKVAFRSDLLTMCADRVVPT